MSWNDQDIDHLFQGAKAPEPPPFEEAFWTEMEAMLPPENHPVDAVFREAKAPVPPFREAYWAEMEAMLPQKKRRAAAFWWFSGGAAMVALALALWYFAGSTETTGNNRVAANQGAAGEATGPDSKGRKSSAPIDGPAQRIKTTAPVIAPATPAGPRASSTSSVPGDGSSPERTSADTPHQGEPLPQQTAGIISATTGAVTPLNPLPFEYELDDVGRRLPDAELPKPARFYAQLSMGVGQSAQRNVPGASDFLHYYSAGGGLYTRVDNMVLTFGLNGRVDFTDNIVRTVGTQTPGNRVETRYKQLYSIETPASLGYTLGRNVITATVTPGFQTGFSGQENEFVEETQVRSERTSGKVKNSRTLTMEFGLSYWRVLQPDWQLGVGMNFDALRPFNNALFSGEQRMAPLNGQIILRRTF